MRNEEIAGHNHNLNLPRSIDSSEAEDIQDCEAHLRGGIPECAIDILKTCEQVCPQLHEALSGRCGPAIWSWRWRRRS